jgi:transmembrane sensor
MMIKNLQAFLRLLDRYQKKRMNPEENKLMDMWYDSIDHTENQGLDEEKTSKLMWAAINEGMDSGNAREVMMPLPFWKRNFYLRLAAACLLFVAVFAGYRYALNSTTVIAGVENEILENLNQFTNKTANRKTFRLPDGSQVTLEPGARLFFPRSFEANERRVYLTGDVFFDIARDTSRPFYVHANNIVTKVLGTSFTIKENKNKNSIEVAVLTGVVEVQQREEKQSSAEKKVVLTQNKKVTFYKQEEKLVTGIVEQPKIISIEKADAIRFNFNYLEKPLAEILPVLEKAYGVKINISNSKLRNCIITADLSQESTLFTQLEILCESIDAKYQLVNDSVMLSGKGCDLSK